MKTINVKINPELSFAKEARYIFQTYGYVLGICFKIVRDDEKAHLCYGYKAKEKSIGIPSDNYQKWLENQPSLDWRDGIPVMYVEKPKRDSLYFYEDEAINLTFDIIAASFYLLSREEERLDKRRDTWGCFSGNYTILKKLGVLDFPVVNSYAFLLKQLLDKLFPAEFDYTALNKDNKKFSVCLIHDVDQPFKGDIYSGLNMLKRYAHKFKGIKQATKHIIWGFIYKAFKLKDPYCNFQDYIKLEGKYGFKSIFNFASLIDQGNILYDPTYSIYNSRIIKIMELIKARGWEIGLHGSYESYLDKDKLSEEKNMLERVIKNKVGGICQHYLRLDYQKTWDVQRESGIEYDMSLGYNEALGFRAGAAFPFFPYNRTLKRAHMILELPLVIMDSALFMELNFGVEEATRKCIQILEKIKEFNGFACILWHLRVWDTKAYPGWIEVYKNILEYLSKENAWVALPNEIAGWWKDRVKHYGYSLLH